MWSMGIPAGLPAYVLRAGQLDQGTAVHESQHLFLEIRVSQYLIPDSRPGFVVVVLPATG